MEKLCCRCDKEKYTYEFNKNKSRPDGLSHICSECHRDSNRKYYKKNKEKKKIYAAKNKNRIFEHQKKYRQENHDALLEKEKQWRLENKEKCKHQSRQWYLKNKDKALRNTKQWKKDNPEKHKQQLADYGSRYPEKRLAWTRKRQADKIKRTPAWANHAAITAYYKEAQRLHMKTGIRYHVDHIVPLKGKNVSGFHVENNLQVIPATVNLRKSNTYSVDKEK